MSLTTWVNIASLFSSAAVLVSLIFVGWQIRQAARNQRSIMDRGRSQQVGDWLQFIGSPDIAPVVIRGNAGDAGLDAATLNRYLWRLYPLFLHFEDSYYQNKDGMIGEDQYASTLGHLKDQFSAPGFRALWRHIRDRFPRDFVGYMDGLMRDAPITSPDWSQRWKDLLAEPKD